MRALRQSRYKYIHYHGIWDTDELYDLQEDPLETQNLIRSQEHQNVVKDMKNELSKILSSSAGMYIPLYRDTGGQNNLRYEHGTFRGRISIVPETRRSKSEERSGH